MISVVIDSLIIVSFKSIIFSGFIFKPLQIFIIFSTLALNTPRSKIERTVV
ncbi:ORF112 [Staphylococcus phage X2]|uniref:ORF112 n=1 Tax=Staphylococcus phage X2 TaxID=2908152 RepID=Q4ZA67_9CAUD|nr:ORF112 [Staphylococcus phage X2]AAX92074.1 ORF112 [Staphylococcus phage X2]